MMSRVSASLLVGILSVGSVNAWVPVAPASRTASRTSSISSGNAGLFFSQSQSQTQLHMSSTETEPTDDTTTEAPATPSAPEKAPVAPSTNTKALYKDLVEFNKALNKLAEQCADPSLPSQSVIARAADCETAYREVMAESIYHSNNVDSSAEAGSDKKKWHPDIISFNTVLKAWGRCCATMAETNKSPAALAASSNKVSLADISSVPVYTARDAADRANNWLNQQTAAAEKAIEKAAESNDNKKIVAPAMPDVQSFNIVMDAWAKSRATEAPAKVEALLHQLERMDGLEADSLTYNALVDAYAYSDAPDRLEKLQGLWADMDRLQKETNGRIRPTFRTVNSILHAHSRSVQELERNYNARNNFQTNIANGNNNNASTRNSNHNNHDDTSLQATKIAAAAEKILRDCLRNHEATGDATDQPDVMTFTTVMDAYARCGTMSGAQNAERLLTELKNVYRDTGNERFRPNSYTYTTVISAWKRTMVPQGPARAQELLEELLAEKDLAPDSRAFTSTIQCWARSRDGKKAAKALQLLQRMKQISEKWPDAAPTLISYNTAIDACARTRGDAEQQTAALKIAFAIFKAVNVSEVMDPNHVTYATLLKAASFLMPPGDERNKVAEAVFSKAVAAGMVEGAVVKNLQKATDASVLQRLLKDMQEAGSGHIDYRRIPPLWSKHVK
jgi:hypothetical protein